MGDTPEAEEGGEVTRRIPNTSPTQIKLFARCPRAYWYTYPGGERQPAGPAAELGTRLHKEFENLVLDERACSFGGVRDARVEAAVELLSDAEALDSVLESWVQVGHVKGRVDLLVVDGEYATVLDLKTTSSDRYALSPDDVGRDIQMVCYGLAVADAHPDVRYVLLVHLYTLTKGPAKAWRSEKAVHVDELRATYQIQIAPLVDGARALWSATEPPDPLPNAPHTPACNAYGGCPFRSRCGERFPVPVEDPMVGLLENLYKRLDDENRVAFDAMCEHTDFASWDVADLAGAHDVLRDMVAAQEADAKLRELRDAPDWVYQPGDNTVYNVAPYRTGGASIPASVVTEALQSAPSPQPVLPPDASPNAALDPLDVPLTEVAGLGPTVAERWASIGIDTVRAYTNNPHLTDDPTAHPKGWTAAKHEAVLAYAKERDRPTPQAPAAEAEVEDTTQWHREHYESVIERLRTHVFAAMHAIDHALSALDELE